MGLAQVIGTLLAQGAHLGTIQTPNEEITETINGWEHTVEFVAPWVGIEALIPQRFAQDPTYGGLFLMDGHVKKWMGNLGRISLSYRTPDYPITDESGVPPDEFQENPSAQQVSVVEGTHWGNATYYPTSPQCWTTDTGTKQFTGFIDTFADYGEDTIYQGAKTLVHTQYTARLSASLFSTTLNDPPDPDRFVVIVTDMPGSYDGSGKKYLRLTSEINPAGLWWTKKNTYLYRDKAWSTNAYDVEVKAE